MMSPRSFLVSRQNQRQRQTSSTTTTTVTLPSPPPSVPVAFPVRRKDDRQAGSTSSSSSANSIKTTIMPAVKRKQESRPSPSPSPPTTTLTLTRPNTPTSPVRIPVTSKSRETAHPQKHNRHGERRHKPEVRPRDVHSPDAIPASVAALLAVTSIPPPRSSRSSRQRRALAEKRMTVESVIERSQEVEKEFSLNLGKSPLDLLLSAPEDLDDDISVAESNVGSAGSPFSRTASLDSVPSLYDDSFTAYTLSSVETPSTPFTSPKSRKSQPSRKSLEPVSSPQGEVEEHPLSSPLLGVEEMDFRVFDESPAEDVKVGVELPYRPLKSVKSNLTASLRALKQAARSFSTLNFSSIPPEDFLTRSILTIDPQVPYTDERRPQLEEEPTAALRRYLNPTTNSRIEQPSPATIPAANLGFTASIQMQTYKVQRHKSSGPLSGRLPRPFLDASGSNGIEKLQVPLEIALPGPRQREMRENSDFIRIAVMEMAMRRKGKLDDQRPGRARWALPPRKTSTRAYEVGEDGVPARWVPLSY